jgi:hypothetical protein
MKFLRRTAEHTLSEHKRNEEILEKMKVERVDQKLKIYNSQWLRHATRMNNNRTPKIDNLTHLII